MTLDVSYYFLYESYLIQFPLDSLCILVQCFLLSRLFFSYFSLQSWMLSQGKDIRSFFSINLKDLLKEITQNNFLFFIFEDVLLFDIFYQFVASLAFVVDIIQDVDSYI